jgi:hypothetical protein
MVWSHCARNGSKADIISSVCFGWKADIPVIARLGPPNTSHEVVAVFGRKPILKIYPQGRR